jgi:hypothetical protein
MRYFENQVHIDPMLPWRFSLKDNANMVKGAHWFRTISLGEGGGWIVNLHSFPIFDHLHGRLVLSLD